MSLNMPQSIATEDDLFEPALASLRIALENIPDRRVHVLIDPALGDPLAGIWQERMPHLAVKVVDINGIARERSPYLLTLCDNLRYESVLNTSLRIAVQEYLGMHDREDGQPRSVCAWLVESEATPANQRDASGLAYVFGKRASASNGTVHLPFRFWDPRVTPHLPELLGEECWRNFQAAASCFQWYTLDPHGKFIRIGTNPAASSQNPPQTGWTFNAVQWQALERLHWLNKVARLVPEWGYNEPVPRQHMDQILRRAMVYGLRKDADILRFAQCAILIHPYFDSHPEIARSLHAMQMNRDDLSDFSMLSHQWSDALIDNVRSGQWQQKFTEQPDTTIKSS